VETKAILQCRGRQRLIDSVCCDWMVGILNAGFKLEIFNELYTQYTKDNFKRKNPLETISYILLLLL